MFKIEEFFEECYYVNFIILVCSYFKSDNIEFILGERRDTRFETINRISLVCRGKGHT